MPNLTKLNIMRTLSEAEFKNQFPFFGEAYDPLDPTGNITIKWDIISWTPDGYVAVVTIFNFQQFRHIQAPGWSLEWTWEKKEIIWSMMGGQTTEQGDCSKFKGNVPHCCKKTPTVVDLLPGTPYNQQVANCCKGELSAHGLKIQPMQQVPSSLALVQLELVMKHPKSPQLPSPGQKNSLTPLVQCSSHMCPIKINWHVKLNDKDYWRVKITITNLNYRMNYTQWNLVVQHPNFDHLTQAFSAKYKSLAPHSTTNDTAMLWGIKSYDDVLMQAGRSGNVQLELLFRKDKAPTFTSQKGWAFPRRIYFNGDNCIMPSPDAYPMVA
ncbi:unnamed protein product [Dovyalis caffra]|uniref:COBRA C-terminal domain-containing protein n=1 Tax=Dovyalis caffra TaxID=77055 RepID=A0AAV1SX94_9ROSI|nr:unnamed protein product [Dovyalis caffra]